MKKLVLISLVSTLAATAGAIPAARSSGLDCRSGEICALVCSLKGNTEYSLYEFAHYNAVDGFYTRVVQPDTSTSQESQIQAAAERLGKVDSALQAEFTKDVKSLKLNSTYVWGKVRPNTLTPEEKLKKLAAEKQKDPQWTQDKAVCISQKVAGYSQRLNAFQVNQKIYESFSATDRAGLKARMALVLVGRSKNVGPEHLVDLERLNRRLFYTESDDRILAKSRSDVPSTPTQLQNGIRYRVSLIFPTPTLGVKQLDVRQVPTFRNNSTTVAMNNVPINNNGLPPNYSPGSDVAIPPQAPAQPSMADIQNGYNVPPLNGLPPDMVSAATNGVPMPMPMQGQEVENPAGVTPEVDPNFNTNTPVQGNPEASAAR